MAAEPEIVNHVPDEVCVLVRTSRTDNVGEMYQQVRESLNGALRTAVQHRSARAWADNDDLRRELVPEALQTRFNARSEILQPLERRGISLSASSGERYPWHRVPGSDDITYHFYYALGADRVDFGEEHRDERLLRLDSVRQLVNLLNHPPTGVSAVNGSGWHVSGSAPNWLTVAAQFACGGPAGAPRAETQSGRWRFRFGEDLEQAFKSTPRGEPAQVVVAILDTAPRSATFQTHGNAYLEELKDVVRLHSASDSDIALHREYFDPPPGVKSYLDRVEPWYTDPPPGEVGAQDHGMFVAGIIHDIAPEAEIHLIRVLNDNGIGDALGIGHVMEMLPTALNINANRRLIVNLSLGSTVPVPDTRHWRLWLPRTHSDNKERDGVMRGLLNAAHRSLWSMVNWMQRHNTLVVAAAGNDNLRPETTNGETPPPPRYPARYQEVFAVAAANANRAPASYSNRADIRPLGNGITTFGGELEGRGEGVVGVYTPGKYPDGQPNTTGWAQWSGTSFATPVIAAVAARLWALDGRQQPTQLMERIRGFAVPMGNTAPPDPDPDGPLDAPLLPARQEYAS